MERAKQMIRDAYDAFNREDFDAAAVNLHPDVEWMRVSEVETPIRGKDAVRANMDPFVWSEQRIEITGMEAFGDSLVIDTVFRARGSGSGIELENESFQVWKIKDGMGARFETFLDRDEAVRAAKRQEGLD